MRFLHQIPARATLGNRTLGNRLRSSGKDLARACARLVRVPLQLGVCGLVLGTALAQKALPELPTAEATRLRTHLAEALAGDEKAAKKLTDLAKTWRTKFDHESLVETLREGPLLPKGGPEPRGKGKAREVFERFETVTTGFTFTVGDDTFRYAVDVPADYDPKTPAPVILDPGHGAAAKEDQKGKAGYLGYFRSQADAAGLEHALIVRTEIVEQIGADGLRGERAEDEVSAVFDTCFRDLASRFAIDLDRIWVTGLSQTGFWAWQLGLTRPDRFAGIAPMGAVTWSTHGYLPNLAPLAVFVLHGVNDRVCPVAQPRKTTQALTELGATVRYEEIADGAHDFKTWQHLSKGLAWLAERPRNPYPKRFERHLQTAKQPWCHWLRIDTMAKGGSGEAGQPPVAMVRAEVLGQEVRITSQGVSKLTLCLARELVDLELPVKVVWNDKEKLDRLVERDFASTLALALEKADWRGTFDVALELRE